MNGFLNLYKPSGMSSNYVLTLIKRKFKGAKIGHMGTLDPLASGVLPVAFGKSTRLFDFLLDKEKVYVAEFTFGYETDTLDRGGSVIKTSSVIPTIFEIEDALNKIVGVVDQIPPLYSAKNVNGKRSYDLARNGVFVELKPKKVTINSVKLLEQISSISYKFLIKCKGGTYIRSIARDLAYNLNTVATMTALERTKSGVFTIDNSKSIEEILNLDVVNNILIPPENVINFDKLILNSKNTSDLLNGRKFIIDVENATYKVYGNNEFLGVGIVNNKNLTLKAFLKD